MHAMIKALLVNILSLLCISLQAQTFSVSPNPIIVKVNLDTISNPGIITGFSQITNNTSEVLSLKWKRVINDKPHCWETSVFGVFVQVPPFVDSLDFTLGPNEDGSLNVDALIGINGPELTEGEAEVVLRISNRNDLNDTLLVSFQFFATDGDQCLTSTSNAYDHSLVIYPNPAQNHFQIPDLKAGNISLFDQLGRKIKRFEALPNKRYDIRDLPPGFFWLEYQDPEGRRMNSIMLVKR